MKTTPFAAAVVASVLFAGHAMADSVSTTTVESKPTETSVKKTTYTQTESSPAPVTTERVEKTKVETTQPVPSVSTTTVKTDTSVKP